MRELACGQRRIQFRAFGGEVSLDINGAVPDHLLEPYLPPCRENVASADPYFAYRLEQVSGDGRAGDLRYRLSYRERLLSQSSDLVAVLAEFEGHLSLGLATQAGSRWLFVHAGVVALDGYAVVLPGDSRSGKSTLTAALIAAGASYYSDEFAVIDSEGLVLPYPRALSIRGADPDRPGRRVLPTSLTGPVGSEPLRIGAVLGLRYDSSADWEVDALSSGTAVTLMMPHVVAGQLYPAQSLAWLCRAVVGCRTWRGTRGEASEAVPRIQSLVSGIKGGGE